MTASERLTELHAKLDHLWKLDTISREEVARGAFLAESMVDALPAIAAVVAAAETVTPLHHTLDCWGDPCSCGADRLADALADLNRVLGDKP